MDDRPPVLHPLNADDMKLFAAILVLPVLAGCSTDFRTPGFKPGSAIVRSVHGDVQYGIDGAWDHLRVNLALTNGTEIRTGHDGETYFQIGRAATLKLTEDSELCLEDMMVRDATRIVLELRKGTVLGKVKKLSPKSSFQVRGSGLTVELGGGEFELSDERRVTALAGEMTVGAAGKTHRLHAGEYFDFKKNEVGKVPPEIMDYLLPPPIEPPLRPSPWSPSLSPFERGLENARHGWIGPASGN